MRATNEQSVPAELVERIAELARCIVRLTERARPANTERGRNNSRPVIQFVTQNGFSIVRPWETDGSPAPRDGECRFQVSDPLGLKHEVRVEISKQLSSATALQTCGRIQLDSSFWICCAERQLANYLAEHEGCPDGNYLVVESLQCEEVLLAVRWGKSDEEVTAPSTTKAADV